MLVAGPTEEEDFPLWEVPNMELPVRVSWHEGLLVVTILSALYSRERRSEEQNQDLRDPEVCCIYSPVCSAGVTCHCIKNCIA